MKEKNRKRKLEKTKRQMILIITITKQTIVRKKGNIYIYILSERDKILYIAWKLEIDQQLYHRKTLL